MQVVDNNWLFFRVIVNLGLAHVGAAHDEAAMHAALDRLEAFYLGDGWYSDGPTARCDYYVPFGMHFYGLVYARLAGERDPQRAQRFRERAAAFAHEFVHWFAADGAALPFGRSLTYRFAQGGFWGALAFADLEALPWGVIKGLALRHLRWWGQRPIFQPDGTLSIGYAYPNLNVAEQYNSPGSPYWAMKFFLPLALPASHPFWQAEELPLPELPMVQPQPQAHMILCRDQGGRHVVALTSGQHEPWIRHASEKYAKFAYSTAFGLSVPIGGRGLAQAVPDSMLALSDDGVHYRVRERAVEIIDRAWRAALALAADAGRRGRDLADPQPALASARPPAAHRPAALERRGRLCARPHRRRPAAPGRNAGRGCGLCVRQLPGRLQRPARTGWPARGPGAARRPKQQSAVPTHGSAAAVGPARARRALAGLRRAGHARRRRRVEVVGAGARAARLDSPSIAPTAQYGHC